MYVCGRVPRQFQNAAYIPSYHDIGKLWRGSVSMTESEGSELVRWQRKATVVTYVHGKGLSGLNMVLDKGG